MPHSLGGGSHSGGSHRSSSGRRSRRGGVRMSKTYYPNAHKYMYRDRYGNNKYIFADYMPSRVSVWFFAFQIAFLVPFIMAGGALIVSSISMIFPPAPLQSLTETTQSHIDDQIEVLDDEETLEAELRSFEELTGVCPYIITVRDSEWIADYESLERYSYSLYVNRFADEQHLLLVYSEPAMANESGFIDWSWVEMQGDDVDAIMTGAKFDIFRQDLDKYLTIDKYSVAEAFQMTFSEAKTYIMNRDAVLFDILIMAFSTVFWNVITGIFVYGFVTGFIRGRREYTEVPASTPDADYGYFDDSRWNTQ